MENKKTKWIKNKRKNKDYEGWVGEPKLYDDIGITIFNLLKRLKIKQSDKLLDIGAGSLRVGRFLIFYLEKNNYFGIEPEKWLIDECIKNRLTEKFIEDKGVNLDHNSDFNLEIFDIEFDWVLANSIFIHATKTQVEKCIMQAHKVLKPGGKFLFNFIIGKTDNNLLNWSYPSSVKYTLDFILTLLEDNGFRFKQVDCKYPGKQIFILATKKKERVIKDD